MSVAIAMHVGQYVLFGTDTRLSRMDAATSFQTVLDVQDGYEKLRVVPIGLMTGTGHAALLDSVMTRMSTVSTVQGILDVITDERRRMSDAYRPYLSADQIAHIINWTGWFLAFLTPTGALRLAAYHEMLGHGLVGFPPGMGTCIVPLSNDRQRADATLREVSEILAREIRVCDDEAEMSDSGTYHIALMRRLLTLVADRLPATVSRDAMIGVYTLKGITAVSKYPPLN